MKYRVVEHSWEQSSIYEGDNPICLVQIDGNVTEDTQDEFEEEMDERAQMICDALNKADLAQSLADALEAMIRDLPSNKDWLDPMLERMSKDALARFKGESI